MTKGAYISPAITDISIRETLQSILDELEGGSITIANGDPTISGRAGRLWLNAATNNLYIFADGEWKSQGSDKIYHAVRCYWVDPQGITDGSSSGQTAPPAPSVTVTWSNLSNSNPSSGLALPTYGRTGQTNVAWLASPPSSFNAVTYTIWWSDVVFIRNQTEASTTAVGTTPVQHTYISGTVTFTGANGITKDGSGNTVIDGGKIDTDSIKADSIDLTSNDSILNTSEFANALSGVGGSTAIVSASQPSGTFNNYDLWFDSTAKKTKYYLNGVWNSFSLEADSIVASFITGMTINANQITGNQVTSNTISGNIVEAGGINVGHLASGAIGTWKREFGLQPTSSFSVTPGAPANTTGYKGGAFLGGGSVTIPQGTAFNMGGRPGYSFSITSPSGDVGKIGTPHNTFQCWGSPAGNQLEYTLRSNFSTSSNSVTGNPNARVHVVIRGMGAQVSANASGNAYFALFINGGRVVLARYNLNQFMNTSGRLSLNTVVASAPAVNGDNKLFWAMYFWKNQTYSFTFEMDCLEVESLFLVSG